MVFIYAVVLRVHPIRTVHPCCYFFFFFCFVATLCVNKDLCQSICRFNRDTVFTLFYLMHMLACVLTCLPLNEYWLIDWSKILLFTYRNSHTGFPLVPKLMTLNNLEWRYFAGRYWASYVTIVEVRLILSSTKNVDQINYFSAIDPYDLWRYLRENWDILRWREVTHWTAKIRFVQNCEAISAIADVLLFLQCFDTVGWVIWPVKPVPDMTYNVFGGMLNLALSIYSVHRFSVLVFYSRYFFMLMLCGKVYTGYQSALKIPLNNCISCRICAAVVKQYFVNASIF